MKKILLVIGTRPNFIKVTQFKRIAASYNSLDIRIVHTGQHHSENMAAIFFSQFELHPDHYLEINSSSALNQMGEILIKLENYINTVFKPDLIITPGDVNSTLAVAIVANKLNIPLAHLESGLRSFDRQMPEEINRILTDEVSDYYFVTEKSGSENLKREGKKGTVFFVGNTMIDTLVAFEKQIDQSGIRSTLGITSKYIVMTIHRPSNVDSFEGLQRVLNIIRLLAEKYQVVLPVHPRTLKNLQTFGLSDQLNQTTNVIITDALGYFEFQNLVKFCEFVITDSGGIQEETTFRQKPCLTLRDTTERPVTCELGTNTLVPFKEEEILFQVKRIEDGTYKKGMIPDLWDGQSTKRILEIIDGLPL